MYNKRKFPHYGKIAFPEHLKKGETVWIRKGMGEWEIGAEFGPKVKTAGPLIVIKITDRPTNTTPLIRVREQKHGYESDLCASLLSRESSEPSIMFGVLLWEGRNDRTIRRIREG